MQSGKTTEILRKLTGFFFFLGGGGDFIQTFSV